SYHYQPANTQLYLPPFLPPIFHLINHPTFKPALFIITRPIHHSTRTPHLKNFPPLLTIIPISFTLTLITTLTIPPLPPFNPFLSKHKFLHSIINLTHLNLITLNTLPI
ncbi:proton-conducting transporter transmembrane domain-containing protein, partial [Staphylococcus epidermidis]|uniref:proton-conducting transporter transmembrane domain-containing protein n=1 Tax=Staphylococcus epidermidis TaxID=1282 RepID=UPI0021B2F92E